MKPTLRIVASNGHLRPDVVLAPSVVSASFEDKLQQLVLTYPIAGVEIEKLVDRLLATLDRQ